MRLRCYQSVPHYSLRVSQTLRVAMPAGLGRLQAYCIHRRDNRRSAILNCIAAILCKSGLTLSHSQTGSFPSTSTYLPWKCFWLLVKVVCVPLLSVRSSPQIAQYSEANTGFNSRHTRETKRRISVRVSRLCIEYYFWSRRIPSDMAQHSKFNTASRCSFHQLCLRFLKQP
jgi:hypothetical protein